MCPSASAVSPRGCARNGDRIRGDTAIRRLTGIRQTFRGRRCRPIPRTVELRLRYPEGDDIEYLTRRLTAVQDAPALDLELTIHARRPTRQPVGLHPIVRLPEWPAQLEIDALFEFGVTYPAVVPPGVGRVIPGQRFSRLASIPASTERRSTTRRSRRSCRPRRC